MGKIRSKFHQEPSENLVKYSLRIFEGPLRQILFENLTRDSDNNSGGFRDWFEWEQSRNNYFQSFQSCQ